MIVFAWSHWLRIRRRLYFPGLRDLALETELTPQRLETIEQGNRPDHGEAVKIARAFGNLGQDFLRLLEQPDPGARP
jgi:hypothetical protein